MWLVLLLTFPVKWTTAGGSGVVSFCVGKDLELPLNHSSKEVRSIFMFHNGSDIASSTKVESMNWTEVSTRFKGRLLLQSPKNVTVMLRNLTQDDSGHFKTVARIEEGYTVHLESAIKVIKPPKWTKPLNITVQDNSNSNCFSFICGTFLDLGTPPVTFSWTVGNSTNHTMKWCKNEALSCTVNVPTEDCRAVESLSAHYNDAKSRRKRNGQYIDSRDTEDVCEAVLDENSCPKPKDGGKAYETSSATTNMTLVVVITIVVAVTACVTVILVVLFRKRKKSEKSNEEENVSMRGGDEE